MASSPLPFRVRSRTILALGALSLVTACGGANDPGISVTNAQSDVIFAGGSATPSPSGAAVPGTDPGPGGDSPTLPMLPSSFPTLEGFDNDNPPFQFPQPGSSNAPTRSNICPGPPVFSSAPTAATTFVQGQPKPGFQLFQNLTIKDLGSNIKSTTAKYSNFEIKNVSPVTERANPGGEPTKTFTYDVAMDLGKGNTLIVTFQVKQNAQGQNVATGNVGKPRRVSEPDAGIAIKAQELRNSQGEVTASFKPSVPVLLLPLPVQGGADFTGAGTDPTTGGSMQVNGTVKGPDRVSGCNEFIQGIRVDATVTSQNVPSQKANTVTQVLTFETQYGGLLVGSAQTPTNSDTTSAIIVGDSRPSSKPRSIPKEQQL